MGTRLLLVAGLGMIVGMVLATGFGLGDILARFLEALR